jgi:hypothetical protein
MIPVRIVGDRGLGATAVANSTGTSEDVNHSNSADALTMITRLSKLAMP